MIVVKLLDKCNCDIYTSACKWYKHGDVTLQAIVTMCL